MEQVALPAQKDLGPDPIQPSPGAHLELEDLVTLEEFTLLKQVYLERIPYEVLSDEKSQNQQGKYAYLEQLTTEELDELLRLEFNADEEDADPELVLAIMEVIAKREPEDIPPIDPEETWKTFQARNLTKPSEQTTEDTNTKQEETIVEYQPPHRRKRWFASVVAAACAVFVFCAPVAHGSTILETMTNWKQSTFSLPNQQETGTVAVLTNPDYLKVVEAVEGCCGYCTATELVPGRDNG